MRSDKRSKDAIIKAIKKVYIDDFAGRKRVTNAKNTSTLTINNTIS